MRSGWRPSFAGCGRRSCWRRPWSRTSTRIIPGSAVSCATPPASPGMAASPSCARWLRTPSSSFFLRLITGGRAARHHADSRRCVGPGDPGGLDGRDGSSCDTGKSAELHRDAIDPCPRAGSARRRRTRHCTLSQRSARHRFSGPAGPQREPILTWNLPARSGSASPVIPPSGGAASSRPAWASSWRAAGMMSTSSVMSILSACRSTRPACLFIRWASTPTACSNIRITPCRSR